MKIVIGLGNPGRRYLSSLHNVGFRVVDKIGREISLKVNIKKDGIIFGEKRLSGEKVVLAKPLTFMNLSGRAVGYLVRGKRAKIESLLVICDDLDLAAGVIRLRPGGQSGGHKGLASIIAGLGTNNFPRLRIGIGRPAKKEDTTDFLLSGLSLREQAIMRKTEKRAAEAALSWLGEGIEKAMNRFNRKNAA